MTKNLHAKSDKILKGLKRNTRRKFSSEEKIRIVLSGMQGDNNVADICRIEQIHPTQYYKWSKDFMKAGKIRLDGDTKREANTSEVQELKSENQHLKQLVADLSLKNDVLKKSLKGLESL